MDETSSHPEREDDDEPRRRRRERPPDDADAHPRATTVRGRVVAIVERRRKELARAVRRDVAFLLVGAVACAVVAYVESHASDGGMRGAARSADRNETVLVGGCSSHSPRSRRGIIDAGFILTAPLHSLLARRRDANDVLAAANSLLLAVPLAYAAHVTLWRGDFRLSFRLIAAHLFRSLCGWFTYLPPDPEFLSSPYDLPEAFLCLFRECAAGGDDDAPFLTFFSGHVATVAIVANHLHASNRVRPAVALRFLNGLQALRLLATRGHYSIDLIAGHVAAAWVSGPAGRVGAAYSRGVPPPSLSLPRDAAEGFAMLVGASSSVDDAGDGTASRDACGRRGGRRGSRDDVRSETSARIAADIVADIARSRMGRR